MPARYRYLKLRPVAAGTAPGDVCHRFGFGHLDENPGLWCWCEITQLLAGNPPFLLFTPLVYSTHGSFWYWYLQCFWCWVRCRSTVMYSTVSPLLTGLVPGRNGGGFGPLTARNTRKPQMARTGLCRYDIIIQCGVCTVFAVKRCTKRALQ